MAQRRQTTGQSDARRTTRAQRRAAERRQQKAAGSRGGFPTVQVIGALIAIAIVALIVVGAYMKISNVGGKATGPAVTTPGAYAPKSEMLKVGTQAPDFTLTDTHGTSFSLSAQRGHPVLLEFFAVWCPHCQREAPIIQSLYKQYQSQGVRVWSILASPYGPNYDNSFGLDTTPASAADLRWFANTFHEHVPQLVDPSFRAVNEYGISSYPGIYVIDKNGKIIHSSAGEQPRSVLANAIDSALHGS
jgi:peroxiredoxin